MPWPLWPRDMLFKATGIFDPANKACLTCMSSVDTGSMWFGQEVPNTEDGHVRIIIKRGYHFFQRIDDNKTRYITIFNTDPQVAMTPTFFINFFITKICYQMLKLVQSKAKDVPNSEYGERIKRRSEFYGKIQKVMAQAVADEQAQEEFM